MCCFWESFIDSQKQHIYYRAKAARYMGIMPRDFMRMGMGMHAFVSNCRHVSRDTIGRHEAQDDPGGKTSW